VLSVKQCELSRCLWPPCVADADIIFLSCGFFFFLLFFFFSSPNLSGSRVDVCHNSPSAHHSTTLSGYIFAAKARIDNRGKNLLNSNVSPTCSHNMVNFGPLTAEICWRVWDTPAHFNRFRDLAVLLHGTLVVGVSQTAALNRGRHPYSQGGQHVGHWPTFLVRC